jgi:hypothetical protein
MKGLKTRSAEGRLKREMGLGEKKELRKEGEVSKHFQACLL